jgi:hypothetical protein
MITWLGAWAFIIICEVTHLDFPLYLPVGVSLGTIAIATFMGFFFWGLDPGERRATTPSAFERTRLAITASFVILYVTVITYMLVMPAFRRQLLSDETSDNGARETGQLLGASGEDVLRNFSWLVGAVVGFYFLSTLGQAFIERNKAGDEH